ncbi:DKNYY domain-containing protein, partial [Salmonella enterica]|nr:DKNYY domain-containing protein [Salmonella enterica]
ADKQGNPLDVDAESFQAFGGRWLHDRHRVYGEGEYGAQRRTYWYEVEDADIATFEALNLRYARDRERAYYITGKTIRTKS